MNPGNMRDRVTLLSLEEADGDFFWVAGETIWAEAEETGERNLFSSVGLGTGTVVLTLRKRALNLHQMAEWKGQRLFLTSIRPKERAPGWLEVTTAMVTVVPCRADPGADPPGAGFPAVRVEKWARYEPTAPYSTNVICQVLVTPKAVELTPGHLVEIDGTVYAVRLPYTLDLFKNEYEVERTADL